MIFKQRVDNVIEGEYRIVVEREIGVVGNSYFKVFGIGQFGSLSSIFFFFVVWKNGSFVIGWVGQCYICGENKIEIIESIWLLRKRVEKVEDNWNLILYSEDSFIYIEIILGFRKKDNIYILNGSVDEFLKICDGCYFLFFFVFLGLSVLVFLLL